MTITANAVRLDDLEVFAGCSKVELRRISALTTALRFERGHVLIHEGAAAKEFVVIVQGTARVTRHTPSGIEQVAEVGPGDFLGEMALLSGGTRTATVTATSELEVLVSSVAEFRSIMEIAPSVARKVRAASIARTAGMAAAA